MLWLPDPLSNFEHVQKLSIMYDFYVRLRATTYDHGWNTESYGPIQIATIDAGLYPWLIRRPIRECVTWALLHVLEP